MSATPFDELLRRVTAADVRFVLIGGLAVNAWGYLRGTKDVDIVPDPDPVNLRRLAEVAAAAGGRVQTGETSAGSAASIAAVLSAGSRGSSSRHSGASTSSRACPACLLTQSSPSGRSPSTSWMRPVSVCSREDLRRMKRAAGRTSDLADLEGLEDPHPFP